MIDTSTHLAIAFTPGLVVILVMLVRPPTSRLAYLAYSGALSAIASISVWGILASDSFFHKLFYDQNASDAAHTMLTNQDQTALVIVVMILGGLATNLFVTGLSFGWLGLPPSSSKNLDAVIVHSLDATFDNTVGTLALLPNGSSRSAYLDGVRQSPRLQELLMKLSDAKLADSYIAKFGALK